MSVPLTNSKDIVANNIYLINSDGTLKNVIDIVGDLEGGLTPEQLQTLSQISTAINNDPLFFTTIQNQINSKRNILDSYSQIETDTKLNIKLNTNDFNTTNATNLTNQNLVNTTNQNSINNINNVLNTKVNISDNNATLTSLLTNINARVLTNDYNLKVGDINTTFGTKLNILDNNVTVTSLLNNINSRVLTNDYNLKVDNINTTFGTKLNISDNNVTVTSLLNNITSRVLTNDYNLKVGDINTTFGTKINISDNNVTVTSLLNNINSRVLTSDYNLKVGDINTTFGTKLNILDNNVTVTSLLNNINSRVLTSDYNLKVGDINTTFGTVLITTDNNINTLLNNVNTRVLTSDYNLKVSDINTTFGTKLNISDNNVTVTSLLNNINSRVLTSDYNLKVGDINTTFGTKLNISDNNVTVTSLLNNINSRVLTSDYNLKVGDINTTFGSVLNTTDNNINSRVLTSDYNLKISDINTTFGTKLNISDNNVTITSLLNNINSRVLTSDYNLKVSDINTTFGTKANISDITNTLNSKLNISDNNATLTSLLTDVNSRALNSEFITLKNTPNCKFTPQLPLSWGATQYDNNGVTEWKTLLTLKSDYTYTQTQTSAILSTYDTTITSNTKLSNKLDQLTTTIGGVGGEQGKTIEVDIIQSVPNSTFRGGNNILMNCHQLALPYSLLVGTDIIYNGGLYYHDTPIEQVILNTCSNKSNISDNNVTFTSLLNDVNSRVLTSDYNLKISNINATFGTILNTTDNNINNRVLTSDYNLKIGDINTTFGTKVNISDNNVTLTSLFNNVNSRLLTSDYNLKIDNINTTFGTKLDINNYTISSNSIISDIDTKLNDRLLSTRSQITVGTCFCQYDLRCGDFQCNYVSGPILFQINSMIDTKITPVTASINAIKYTKVFELVRYYPNVKFINLGRINLPLGGCQCEIQLSGSYGWNINNATGVAQDKYTFPNFTATCYIQSSSPGSRRKIFPNSFNTWAPLTPSYDLCHSGYVIVNSPNFMPRGFYLAPVPADNENYVDIWYESWPWSGPLLLKVTQITGGFTTSTEVYDSMPLWGYVKLDMFLNTCLAIYRNPYNI